MVEAPQIKTKYADRIGPKLRDSIQASSKMFKPFLQFRTATLSKICGHHYGDKAIDKRQPINKLNQAIDTLSRLLSSRYPGLYICSKDQEREFAALLMQERISDILKEMRYQKVVQQCVIDAIVLYGISKVGLSPSEDIFTDLEDRRQDPGKTFLTRVSPDYFICDLNARAWEAMQWSGDLVERELDYLLESGLYNEQALKQLTPGANPLLNMTNNDAASLSRGNGTTRTENDLYERVTFYEIWVPRDNVIVSMPVDGQTPIRVVDYFGPEMGPYEMLSLRELPDNIIPLSPAMSWIDISDAVNEMVRKFMRQAQRQRTIGITQKGDTSSAEVIKQANDGEMWSVINPSAVKELSLGGIDEKNFGFTSWMLNQLNLIMGNIELLAGLGAQAETARQESMLQQNSSIQVQDMRMAVEQWTEANCRKLLWYERTDPIRQQVIELSFQGLEVPIRDVLTPELRESDYTLEVIPYTMMPKSPSEELAELKSSVAEIIMPLLPVLQSQGLTIDANQLVQIIADKGDIKELSGLLMSMDPEQQQMQAQQQQAMGKPPATKREYVRRSISGQTNKGLEAQYVQAINAAGQGQGNNQG